MHRTLKPFPSSTNLSDHVGRVLEGVHASYVESVPFRYIAIFTIFQFMYQVKEAPTNGTHEEGEVDICNAEILDELTTSRGEFKVRSKRVYSQSELISETVTQL